MPSAPSNGPRRVGRAPASARLAPQRHPRLRPHISPDSPPWLTAGRRLAAQHLAFHDDGNVHPAEPLLEAKSRLR